MAFSDFCLRSFCFEAQPRTQGHTNKPTWQNSHVSLSTRHQTETFAHFAEMKKKLLAHRNCSVLLGTFSPLRWQRIFSEDLQSASLHLGNWDSLPSRPRERRKFFSFEKLLLFTHVLLRFLPSKFLFWSRTTHTQGHTNKPTWQNSHVSLSTRHQTETFAHFAEMKKTLLAHRNCSVLLGRFLPLRW